MSLRQKNKFLLMIILFMITVISCSETYKKSKFVLLEPSKTGINFKNLIESNDSINLLTYEYLYNGGGVGVGDFNNDGMEDLVFGGNQVKSKMYINQGDFKFVEVSVDAGFDTKNAWCTGITIVDINSDGLDDIYISVGGIENKSIYPNMLFINKGNMKFEEAAKEYGLDDPSHTNHAVFFDFDKDGDLDVFLLNGGGFERSAIEIRKIINDGSARNSDRLYQNNFNKEKGHAVFDDISLKSNITFEGFGLGVGIVDANYDNWPDIYVSNDYVSKDRLYINNQNGSFSEQSEKYFGHFSHFSMGNDVADINNDMVYDIITLDMLPHDHYRRMMMYGPNQYDRFYQSVLMGYGHQYMRNMLHLGQYNGKYMEVGQMTGIDKTDWSWCPLVADFDNDGMRDIYITNGFGKDITDLDYVNFRKNVGGRFNTAEQIKQKLIKSLEERPSIETSNFLYKNNGNLDFENVSHSWGLDQKSISNGAVYADLDNDGDLEIITNNINSYPFIYENKSNDKNKRSNNNISIQLKGKSQNLKGIGSEIKVYYDGKNMVQNAQTARGYQSSISSKFHFGLGQSKTIDSVVVNWVDGSKSKLTEVPINQNIVIDQKQSIDVLPRTENDKILFELSNELQFDHKENPNFDFKIQSNLLHGYSNLGPCIAVGDLNKDGLDDVFFGGALGSNSVVYIQSKTGKFEQKELFTSSIEVVGAIFIDIENDGDDDLILTTNDVSLNNQKSLQIYLNNGKGDLLLQKSGMNSKLNGGNVIIGGDFDKDGDIDIFVGGGSKYGYFPMSVSSYIYENRKGDFVDITNDICKELANIGNVTSAIWTDYNNDNSLDLIVVGEMMKICLFENKGGKFSNITDLAGLSDTHGMWQSITSSDIDEDGDMDYILGNIGNNTSFTSSVSKPLKLYYGDFDRNGSVDPIYSCFTENEYYPFVSLDVFAQQLPAIKKTYIKYHDYAAATTYDLLKSIGVNNSEYLKCETQNSSMLINNGAKGFELKSLPKLCQISPIKGVISDDFNRDGKMDIICIGNDYTMEVVGGRQDASEGHILINKGNFEFERINNHASGFVTTGDSRSLTTLRLLDGGLLVIGSNNDGQTDCFKINSTDFISFSRGEVFALISLKSGAKIKVENNFGSGYFAQKSKTISIVPSYDEIGFYDTGGKQTRLINFN